MNQDKLQCVLAVASTLRQLVQTLRSKSDILNHQERGSQFDGPIAVGERNSEVFFSECGEFIDLLASLIADAESNFEELQGLTLNTDPTLIPTLVSIITIAPTILNATPNSGNDVEEEPCPFEKLVLSSIQCLLQIINVGCIDVYESPLRSRDGGHTVNDPNTVPIEGKKLSELLGAMLKRTELAHSLVSLIDAASFFVASAEIPSAKPPSIILRFGASKLLFTATLRVPAVKASLALNQDLITYLFDASLSEQNNKIRSYHVGTLREIAGSHPLAMTESDENIRAFARLFATDSLSDVRTMSAEAVDVIYRNQPHRWGSCGSKKDLSTAIISRLEDREETSEALVAILRLTETLLIADAALSLGSSSGGTTAESFTEMFATSEGERSLVIAMRGMGEGDSLAARCLRLLIEFSPHYCEVSFKLARHFPSISVVLKAVVALASDKSDDLNIADMRFELSLALGLLLCIDPRARRLLASELKRNVSWMAKLRGALLSNLNHSTLSDFSGIRIIDVIGDHLSDVRNVRWEEELQRPARESLEEFMSDQFRRFEVYESNGGGRLIPGVKKRIAREVPRPDPNGDSLETRLAFVLLTNTIHNTFNANNYQNAQEEEGKERSQTKGNGDLLSDLGVNVAASSRTADVHTEFENILLDTESSIAPDQRDSKIINELSKIDKTFLRKVNNDSYYPTSSPLPGQTRTSLIREWKNNPKKLEAIKRMAREIHESGSNSGNRNASPSSGAINETNMRNFVGRSARRLKTDLVLPSHQYRDNFVKKGKEVVSSIYVDPFQEPTLDSFKKPPKLTMGTLVANARTALRTNSPGQASHNQISALGQASKKRYTKFDASLRLCEKAGQHYVPISELIDAAVNHAVDRKTTLFETSGDGFAQRKQQQKASSHQSALSASAKRLPKTWCVDDLREGDLFYFAVPFARLSAFAIDQIRIQAVRHLNHLKRAYVVVPNNMKGRRWFIFDMSTYVMPHVIAALEDILELIEVHGEQNCRFPLLMFKEGELNATGGQTKTLQQEGAMPDDVPDATLNSGNLFESLDQLKFYFSKMSAINPVAAAATAKIPFSNTTSAAQTSAGIGVGAPSQYLIDLDHKIHALKSRNFEPRTDAKFMKALGGAGPNTVIPTDYINANADGLGIEDEDEFFDELHAIPPPKSFASGQDQDVPLSASRARAMLLINGDDEEIDTTEPLGF